VANISVTLRDGLANAGFVQQSDGINNGGGIVAWAIAISGNAQINESITRLASVIALWGIVTFLQGLQEVADSTATAIFVAFVSEIHVNAEFAQVSTEGSRAAFNTFTVSISGSNTTVNLVSRERNRCNIFVQ